MDKVHRFSRRDLLRGGIAACSIGSTGCLGSLTGSSPEAQVEEHANALQRYTDVSTAINEGYRTSGVYIRSSDGILGTPFINFDVEGLDPETPHSVIYNLTEDGLYDPLALLWYVSSDSRDSPPNLFGKEFDGPRELETGMLPRHYALTVWLYRENPEGLFAKYNPAIQTPSFIDQIEAIRSRLRDLLVGDSDLGESYGNTEKCIETPSGGYGIPFVSKESEGTGGTVPMEPPILLYRLTPDWSYQLTGAEWYTPAAEIENPPSMFGQQFHQVSEGHSPETSQPNHYGLHAWLFYANPRGMFEPFNPRINC